MAVSSGICCLDKVCISPLITVALLSVICQETAHSTCWVVNDDHRLCLALFSKQEDPLI